MHWLVPSRLLVTRAAGRREQRVMGREKGGRRPFSLAFLLPITPLAPLRRARERRLGTSQGCAYNLKWAVASRSLNTGLWVLLRVFTIHTRLAYKSSSNSFTSATRKRLIFYVFCGKSEQEGANYRNRKWEASLRKSTFTQTARLEIFCTDINPFTARVLDGVL